MEEQGRNHGARKLIAAISFYDLGQRKPSSEELMEMAKRFNYEAGAAFLARLNVCLSLAIASRDEKIFADVHEKLTASVLSPARQQEVLSAFGDKLYRTAIVLNRAQILAGIKLLALYAPREGGSTLETEADRYQVGELALAINSFRRFPLWRSGNYRYFLIDPIFMAERLSSYGFYWTVVNGLVDDHLRSQFQSLWGELVQEYVRQLLAESFSAEPGSFLRRPTYSDNGSEVFDCAVVIGDGLIPIEIKGSVLPIADRYAAKAGPFFQGISEKFGGGPGAAVEQLLRNIEHIFSAEHPRECSQIPSGRIRRILPIIIVHEPIFRFGALARTLATEFTTGVKRLVKKIRPSVEPFYIYPFQVLTVEELERLQPYIHERDFDLFDCVRSKAKEDPDYQLGLWEFITTIFLPAKRIKPRANEKMIGRFEWLTKAQSWRVYRGDYYDHSLAERRKATGYAIISARPVGGDKLLWDEVIAYKEYPTAGEAYKAIRAIADSEFPKQPISADWFECQVVDEFGVPIEEPT